MRTNSSLVDEPTASVMPLLASGGRDRLIHIYDVNRYGCYMVLFCFYKCMSSKIRIQGDLNRDASEGSFDCLFDGYAAGIMM